MNRVFKNYNQGNNNMNTNRFFSFMYVLYTLIIILFFKLIQYSIFITINLSYNIEEISFHVYYLLTG
jgi:hypothetical protein